MKQVKFTKMQARGNDFVVINAITGNLPALAVKLCDRKFGIGADGLLVIEKSKCADVRMRIFNADGSEAEMCGNGASCVALWVKSQNRIPDNRQISIETKAGIIKSGVKGDTVKIKLTDPKGLKLDIPIKINNRALKVNFVDTGVPHAVILAEAIEKIDVQAIGSSVRYHKRFSPKGANVDFIEALNKDSIKIRTYERGVEAETLACGTGSVASAIIFACKTGTGKKTVNVHTKSKEMLKVHFVRLGQKFSDVWLEGKAHIVFNGETTEVNNAPRPAGLGTKFIS
ncbi:MAG: diaminopimelate epimerase [Candidatus Omnitrophica bacterium]|nr:diaminopimelate epimerase [Candidatus Omnitrophota bacterium]